MALDAAIALRLAQSGARVTLGARRLEALEVVQASINQSIGASDRVAIAQTDVTKREDVSTFLLWQLRLVALI